MILSPGAHRKVLGAVSGNAQPVACSPRKQQAAPVEGEAIALNGDAGSLLLLNELLGDGGFGSVYRGILNADLPVAAKVVNFDEELEGREDCRREVRAHRALFASPASPACLHLLVDLLHHIEQPSRFILVMPLLRGVELEDWVADQPDARLAEAMVRRLAQPIAQAVAFCHASGVAHLDVKPQNILVDINADPRAPPGIRLIDYGCAEVFDAATPGEAWVEECGGTDNFMSPERHFADDDRGFLAPPADVFSLGCVYFFMLCGHVPFDWRAADTSELSIALVQRVRMGELPYGAGNQKSPAPLLQPSQYARELIGQMTMADPFGRPTAAAVLEHPWLQLSEARVQEAEAEAALDEAFARLSVHQAVQSV